MSDKGKETATPTGNASDDRLAAALRANLRKRKAQARARQSGAADGTEQASADRGGDA
ncbi:MAG: hypothetical protein AAF713_22280 [Pseudomonadota bacterium]